MRDHNLHDCLLFSFVYTVVCVPCMRSRHGAMVLLEGIII